MEQYKYGPLVYNTSESDDETGNFYWNGLAPVGYDDLGIPIDSSGFQCLDIACPIHPDFDATACEKEPNDFLGLEIPTPSSFTEWFEEQFMELEPRDAAFFVLRWIDFQNESEPCSQVLYRKCATMDIEDIIDAVWPSLKAD